MGVDPMAAEGRGEREKGHRWAEALSSVEVLKVNQVSVRVTPMFPSFKSKAKHYVTRRGGGGGVFMVPAALSFWWRGTHTDSRTVPVAVFGCLPVSTHWLHTVHCNVPKCPGHEISLQSSHGLMSFHESLCLMSGMRSVYEVSLQIAGGESNPSWLDFHGAGTNGYIWTLPAGNCSSCRTLE